MAPENPSRPQDNIVPIAIARIRRGEIVDFRPDAANDNNGDLAVLAEVEGLDMTTPRAADRLREIIEMVNRNPNYFDGDVELASSFRKKAEEKLAELS